MNPPATHVQAFIKPGLFESLRRDGLCIPPMLCSSDMDAVNAFCKVHGQTVWRTTTGRAPWQVFRDKQRKHLVHPENPPVWLARLLDGPLVRAYVWQGTPLFCLRHNSPDPGPPERLETVFADACPEAHTLTEGLFQTTGIPWCVATFVLHEGAPYLYDVDPDPVLDWLPESFRGALIHALARALSNRSHGNDHALSIDCSPRQVLFARRMLQPLFVMEASKRS